MISIGDIVSFKNRDLENIYDMMSLFRYSKFMIVVAKIDNEIIKNKIVPICKVMSADGSLNWVASKRIKIVSKLK
jgi:hypothetical protein